MGFHEVFFFLLCLLCALCFCFCFCSTEVEGKGGEYIKSGKYVHLCIEGVKRILFFFFFVFC